MRRSQCSHLLLVISIVTVIAVGVACDSGRVGETTAHPEDSRQVRSALASPSPSPCEPTEINEKKPDSVNDRDLESEWDNLPVKKVTGPELSGIYYVMKGDRYYLLASSEGYVEEGEASYYGRRFQGRKTSSGERFNMNEMTAAHRTLPFNAWVRVINLENNREVTVRINDRGPFEPNDRVIDLSLAAAKAIGMIRAGTAQVRVESIPSGKDNVRFAGLVKEVKSGDTLVVLKEKELVTVRLQGVDCPEIDQPWGERARNFTMSLVEGQKVTVKGNPVGAEPSPDEITGQVYLPDGRRLAILLLKSGLAWWDNHYDSQGHLMATLHLEAQYSGKGLWSDRSPTPPWNWRIRHSVQ